MPVQARVDLVHPVCPSTAVADCEGAIEGGIVATKADPTPTRRRSHAPAGVSPPVEGLINGLVRHVFVRFVGILLFQSTRDLFR